VSSSQVCSQQSIAVQTSICVLDSASHIASELKSDAQHNRKPWTLQLDALRKMSKHLIWRILHDPATNIAEIIAASQIVGARLFHCQHSLEWIMPMPIG
jgi:hypothetical protein